MDEIEKIKLNEDDDAEGCDNDGLNSFLDLLREDGAQECIKTYLANNRESDKEKHNIQMRQLEINREGMGKSTIGYWGVCIIVVIAISILTGIGRIEPQAAIALFGAIIGYLFGRMKKD